MRKPMPLSDLPGYIESVRGKDQDEVPVVEMGRIVQRKTFPLGMFAASILMIVVAGAYISSSTRQITINGEVDFQDVARMVNNEGGSVLSVRKEEEGKYKIRVFTFRRMNLFMNGLSEKAQIEGIQVE